MPLLQRKEVSGTISFTGPTPSLAAVTQALASHYKVGEELVAVTKVMTRFGFQQAAFAASVYTTPEAKKAIEPLHREKKAKETPQKEEKGKA